MSPSFFKHSTYSSTYRSFNSWSLWQNTGGKHQYQEVNLWWRSHNVTCFPCSATVRALSSSSRSLLRPLHSTSRLSLWTDSWDERASSSCRRSDRLESCCSSSRRAFSSWTQCCSDAWALSCSWRTTKRWTVRYGSTYNNECVALLHMVYIPGKILDS